jgi:hypothetical protein
MALNDSVAGASTITMPPQPHGTNVLEDDVHLGCIGGKAPGISADLLRSSAELLGDMVEYRRMVGADAPGGENPPLAAELDAVVEPSDRRGVIGGVRQAGGGWKRPTLQSLAHRQSVGAAVAFGLLTGA